MFVDLRKGDLSETPRCLQPYQTQPTSRKYPSEQRAYQLACPCGCEKWQIEGYHWAQGTPFGEGPDFDLTKARKQAAKAKEKGDSVMFICPLFTCCPQCRRTSILFDVRTHGLAAESGEPSCSVSGHGIRETYQCPSCSGDQFEKLTAEFTYDPEVLEGWFEIPLLLDPKRLLDYFDSFSLTGTCVSCRKKSEITAYYELGT